MLADARASVPELLVFERDDHADQDWLEQIADGCTRYTPMVAIDPPDGLILDITGCAHLFDGEVALIRDIEVRCAALGMALRYATAGAPTAAHALARYQMRPAADETTAIRRLPVAALGLAADATQGLIRAGLKCIGDLASRPMATIAARFGSDAVDALRQLLGEVQRPIALRPTPPLILAERSFAEPIASTDYALHALGEIAAEVAHQLEERKCGGRRFAATFFRNDGLTRMLAIETSQPTRDPKRMMRLFRERIEGMRDPIDPGFGFDLIRLAVPLIEPLVAAQLKLEGGATNEAQLAVLVDRLSIRLGRDRVRRFVPRDTHIPEQAQLALPALDAGVPTSAWPVSGPGDPPMRPLHLFDPPQPIKVIAEVPDGPPHRFRWRRTLHEVRRFEGPERIATEWWRRRDGAADKPGLTRDYYRIEDARGRRFWIFRHGLHDEKPDPGWYLHGLFA